MIHHFDIEIAKNYGVNVAIFLSNLEFWIRKNIANRVHFHDATFWTYNSQPAFLELFPYWSIQTLKTIISTCSEEGLIHKGNYNEKKYDKTNWYALTEKGLMLFNGLKDVHDKAVIEKNSNKINISGNQPMDQLKSTDGSVEINRPIPDCFTDLKPDKNKSFYVDQKKNKPVDNSKPPQVNPPYEPDRQMKNEYKAIQEHELRKKKELEMRRFSDEPFTKEQWQRNKNAIRSIKEMLS